LDLFSYLRYLFYYRWIYIIFKFLCIHICKSVYMYICVSTWTCVSMCVCTYEYITACKNIQLLFACMWKTMHIPDSTFTG
jgi:hypothetical protein